jgi:hypothetical protein
MSVSPCIQADIAALSHNAGRDKRTASAMHTTY